MYEYNATVNKVIDGDTIDVDIDLGFYIFLQKRVRLAKIDTPEKGKPGFQEAKDFLAKILPFGKEITLLTFKDGNEKFGRYLATVYVGSQDVNQTMIDSGLAEEY